MKYMDYKNKLTKFFLTFSCSILFGFSVCQNALSSSDNSIYEENRQSLVSFTNAIQAVSKIYNIDIIVNGTQPDINLSFEIEKNSISNDLRKIIYNYGIRNHVLIYNDKNHSVTLYILDSSTNKSMEAKSIVNLRFDEHQSIAPLTQEQVFLLAQADDANEFYDNLEQPLSEAQIEQLRKNSNQNDSVREVPLSTEQMLLLQETAKKIEKSSDANVEPLSTEQMILLQDSAKKNELEIDYEKKNSPLTDAQMLLIEQNSQ